MKNKFLLLPIIFLTTSCSGTPNLIAGLKDTFTVNDTLEVVNSTNAHVVLLYGQSNATGVSYTQLLEKNYSDIYHAYNHNFDNVYINFITENYNNSSNDTFVPTCFGMGAANTAFGPEMGIAKKLSEAYPNEKSFIIKYSYGGSCLDNQWMDASYNRGQMYTAAINFTKTSLKYLTTKGYNVNVDAICWMQGETDSMYPSMVKRYKRNTERFVRYLRNDLKDYYKDNIYFVDAGIDEYVWKDPVAINKAKQEFASKSSYNIYIDTHELGLVTTNEPEETPDIAHYDSMSMITLGEAFGDASIRK